MSTDLLKQIDDLVASKTFNLDALDGIKKLKDDLAKQLAETELLQGQLKKSQSDNSSLREMNNEQAAKIQLLNSLMKANEETAIKGKDAIWEAKIASAVAEAYRDSLHTVFKPSSVRETVWQSVPISQHSNGYSTVMSYQQETKTTKEEL